MKYYGGKQTKAPWICSLFRPHSCYIEPFAGGAAVYWYKERAKDSILNDTNKGIYSFWKYLKEQPAELKKEIEKIAIFHEDIHTEQREIYRKGGVSMEMAVATFYQVYSTVGSQIDAAFVARSSSKIEQIELVLDSIEKYAKKLQHARIVNRDALAIIDKHKGKEDSLFFIDPPYIDCDMAHYGGYTSEQFESLLKKCEEIQGDFVLTVGDTELCDQYVEKNGWRQIKEDTSSTTSEKNTEFVETVITNYEV